MFQIVCPHTQNTSAAKPSRPSRPIFSASPNNSVSFADVVIAADAKLRHIMCSSEWRTERDTKISMKYMYKTQCLRADDIGRRDAEISVLDATRRQMHCVLFSVLLKINVKKLPFYNNV